MAWPAPLASPQETDTNALRALLAVSLDLAPTGAIRPLIRRHSIR